MEIDHDTISTVILLPSADSFKKGCCQLQAKVCAQLLVNRLFKPAQEKVWLGELTVPAMTIAVDFLSFFLSLLVRSYMSITPGSANLEILIK